jgi:predicted RNase H-like HicB family nuclease
MTYTAVCRRAGDWWAISVPEIKGVHTQARRLDQVEAMARDAIALFLDVTPDSFAMEVRPEVPAEAVEAVAARKAAREAETWADKLTRAAATALLAKGYTVRDAGALLNISPQRVSQLTAGSSARNSAKLG